MQKLQGGHMESRNQMGICDHCRILGKIKEF
jgi:hypothetical protein